MVLTNCDELSKQTPHIMLSSEGNFLAFFFPSKVPLSKKQTDKTERSNVCPLPMSLHGSMTNYIYACIMQMLRA